MSASPRHQLCLRSKLDKQLIIQTDVCVVSDCYSGGNVASRLQNENCTQLAHDVRSSQPDAPG